MHPAIQRIIETQLRNGFPDIRGADATLTIPISDRLVNESIAAFLPPDGKVREVTIQSHDGTRFTARVRTGSIWSPPRSIELGIARRSDRNPQTFTLVQVRSARGVDAAGACQAAARHHDNRKPDSN